MIGRSPQKVLHIFSGDLWAGAEVVIFHLLNDLRREARVEILALSLNEGILVEKLRTIGIETRVIPEARNSFCRILYAAWRLFKHAEVNIIHSHGYKQNLLAIGLSKLFRVKRLVTTLHGMPEPTIKGSIKGAKALFLASVDYRILNRYFTHIVSVSLEMRERLVREHNLSPEKITVIRNGIASPMLLPCSPESNVFHIGNVGRLVPVKDFDLFLEVASRIERADDRARFSILGDGPLRDHLMRRAEELGIHNHVRFLPACSDPFPYYRSLHLLLNTSRHEGIPLSILEAMACGLAVVAPCVGGIPEVIEDRRQGFLVNERRSEIFAEACLKIMESPTLRKEIGNNARQRFVDGFSSSRMASSYLDLYRAPAS